MPPKKSKAAAVVAPPPPPKEEEPAESSSDQEETDESEDDDSTDVSSDASSDDDDDDDDDEEEEESSEEEDDDDEEEEEEEEVEDKEEVEEKVQAAAETEEDDDDDDDDDESDDDSDESEEEEEEEEDSDSDSDSDSDEVEEDEIEAAPTSKAVGSVVAAVNASANVEVDEDDDVDVDVDEDSDDDAESVDADDDSDDSDDNDSDDDDSDDDDDDSDDSEDSDDDDSDSDSDDVDSDDDDDNTKASKSKAIAATAAIAAATAATLSEADIIAAHDHYAGLAQAVPAVLAAATSPASATVPHVKDPATPPKTELSKTAKAYDEKVSTMKLGSRLSSVELNALAEKEEKAATGERLKEVAEVHSPRRGASPVRATAEVVETPTAAAVPETEVAEDEAEKEEEDVFDYNAYYQSHYKARYSDATEDDGVYVLPHLEAQQWISILFMLSEQNDVLKLAYLSKALKKLILDPAVISSWLLRRSTHYLAIYNTYKNFPRLLTPPVAHALISLGAHIPRQLSSLIALENPEILDRSSTKAPTPYTEALELLVWTGKSTYGDMFGFDAETAVNATLAPGQEAHEVINAKVHQYKKVLGWAYEGVVDQRLEGSQALEDKKEEKKRRKKVMEDVTDADAFLHLLELYRGTFVGKETFVVDLEKPSGAGRFVAAEKKRSVLKDTVVSEQEKQRNKIAAALRELSNIYRFAPGLVADKLEVGWLPVDLFERDVELAWFLLRHAGDAKSRVVTDAAGYDDVTYRTLLGYRVHISVGTSTLAGGAQDVVPFSAISKLIAQGNISLTDAVLLRMMGKFTNQMTLDRLLRFVSRSKMQQIGEVLLTECFEKPMLDDALASGYISRPIQRAEILVKIFSLDKDAIARSFMGTPRDWDTYVPPPSPQSTCTYVKQPTPNKQDGLYQYDVGMLTRQAQASGGLPWVSWQWVVQHLGAQHPVASACLHDVSVRSFNDHAPLNPGDHDAISFPRKEADASVKALLALGVGARMCTVSTAIRKALYEIEVAALSGEAAQAMKSQAAQLSGKKGKIAAAVAAAASAAGANAISRRYIYILTDIEKKLLAFGSDEPVSSTGKQSTTPGSKGGASDTASISSGVNGASPIVGDSQIPLVEVSVNVTNGEEVVSAKKLVPLYPQALLPQPRAIWFAAIKALVTENDTWKDLGNSPVSPNACRRFCQAASNISRGLEQFGMPASALAVLKSRKGSSKTMKSMSSSDSENTMLYGLWVKEIEAEDAEKEKLKRGLV
ncbi:hypothetical protein BCR33DRAFT_713908 [Rhizoclosmatium globosum]|uniref:Uncharacterized protein n=1 Tax=Rhizoclosmatium globosum TaxID=329046 RepID=A0A1Y2CRC2_9FUNG|nr:hypothetical protein BCR33DRAFT_713908 [Rhizoclosmatium globosum]|eukprot:ORY49588.1 hypothetical protein BCR33DRAFT_713908 [Rhizoclosmatium globosum]